MTDHTTDEVEDILAERRCRRRCADELTSCLREWLDAFDRREIDTEDAVAGMGQCTQTHNFCSAKCSRRPTKRFSDDEKDAFARGSSAWWKASGVFGFAGVASAAIGPLLGLGLAGVGVGIVLGAAAAWAAWNATNVSDLSLDPVDPHFHTIIRPAPPKPPIITENHGISAPAATALNAMLANQAVSVGLGRAVIISLNRAEGAEAANDLVARDRQLAASRMFAGQWAQVLEDGISLQSETASQLTTLGVGNVSIPLTDAPRLRSEILVSGWPQPIQEMLTRYGIRGNRRKEVLGRMTAGLYDTPALTVKFADMG
jgi:hypothetical protein